MGRPAPAEVARRDLRELVVVRCVLALAAAGCALGALAPPDVARSAGGEVVALVRLLTTSALVVALLLGPGLVLRTGRRTWGLGLACLPGLALVVGLGLVLWVGGSVVPPRALALPLAAATLAWLWLATARRADGPLTSRDERFALALVGGAALVAVGRSLWSVGPVGEGSPGTVGRTLEAGDRPDSIISYDVMRLVLAHVSPTSRAGRDLMAPFTFSERGPLAGVGAAIVALLAGARPEPGFVVQHWTPFDAQGVMAYRLAMIGFGATALLAVWGLAERLAGVRAARLALLLAVTSPFVVHELWFTWPKLLAAGLSLLAAQALLDRRPWLAAVLVAAGYFAHPLALLSVPPLLLLAAWPTTRPRWRAPAVGQVLPVVAGVALALVAWRVVNGSQYEQTGFLEYLGRPGRPLYLDGLLRELRGLPPVPTTAWDWLASRAESVANTLVPGAVLVLSPHDPSVNVVDPSCWPFCRDVSSPLATRLAFLPWATLPFGVGILLLPLLVGGLWRAARRWPWPVAGVVVVPFVLFAIYWGDAVTGLLREGLHPWVLTLLVVLAVDQHARGFPWWRARWARALLALRAVEVLLVAVGPTIATRHVLVASSSVLTDAVALLAMAAGCAGLGWATWREGAARA